MGPPDREEVLGLSADVLLAGPRAAGYAGMQRGLERGLAVLQRLSGLAEPPR